MKVFGGFLNLLFFVMHYVIRGFSCFIKRCLLIRGVFSLTHAYVLQDIASKVMAFSQQGPRTVCILSANGAICNVTIRQPATSGGTVSYGVHWSFRTYKFKSVASALYLICAL